MVSNAFVVVYLLVESISQTTQSASRALVWLWLILPFAGIALDVPAYATLHKLTCRSGRKAILKDTISPLGVLCDSSQELNPSEIIAFRELQKLLRSVSSKSNEHDCVSVCVWLNVANMELFANLFNSSTYLW